MIITFVNKIPSCGKTSLCIALANKLNDLPGDESKNVIIFDCDPKHTSYTKYDTYIKKYRKPPTNYQVLSLPLDEDGLVYKVINDVKDREGFFLFDMPPSNDESLYLRILVSSHIVVVPISENSINKSQEFVDYLHTLKTCLMNSKIKARSTFIVTPVFNKKEPEVELSIFQKPDIIISPPVRYCEEVSEKLKPLDMTDFECLPFNDYVNYILKILKDYNNQAVPIETTINATN